MGKIVSFGKSAVMDPISSDKGGFFYCKSVSLRIFGVGKDLTMVIDVIKSRGVFSRWELGMHSTDWH